MSLAQTSRAFTHVSRCVAQMSRTLTQKSRERCSYKILFVKHTIIKYADEFGPSTVDALLNADRGAVCSWVRSRFAVLASTWSWEASVISWQVLRISAMQLHKTISTTTSLFSRRTRDMQVNSQRIRTRHRQTTACKVGKLLYNNMAFLLVKKNTLYRYLHMLMTYT